MISTSRKGILLVTGILFFTSAFAQTPLSKKEIFDNFVQLDSPKASYDKSIQNLSVDIGINNRINMAINDLREKGVDTFMVLINSYPGSHSIDTCKDLLYPSEVFILWKLAGQENLMNVPNRCGIGGSQIMSSRVFEYYDQNQKSLRREIIMPVILSATMQNGKVQYTREDASHDTLFALFYYISGDYKSFRFSKRDVYNKESIFYNDNINTKVYKWFLLFEKMIGKDL